MNKSQKDKKRYILFQILSLEEKGNIKSVVYKSILKFFGEYGFSKIGFKFIYYNPNSRFGILRCNNYSLNAVLGFLALLKEPRMHAIKISGTIKKLKDYISTFSHH